MMVLMVAGSLPVSFAEGSAPAWEIPQGATVHVSDSIRAQSVSIFGVLVIDASGEFSIEAERLVVGSGGVILGPDGIPGAAAQAADAEGAPGGDAGTLIVSARELIVAPGGAILGGTGGAGGDAHGTQTAVGGDG